MQPPSNEPKKSQTPPLKPRHWRAWTRAWPRRYGIAITRYGAEGIDAFHWDYKRTQTKTGAGTVEPPDQTPHEQPAS